MRVVAMAVTCLALVVPGCVGGLTDYQDFILQPDEYVYFSYILEGDVFYYLEIDVDSDDVVYMDVMDEINFQAYEAGNEYIVYTDCSSSGFADFYQSCEVDPGVLYVVFETESLAESSRVTFNLELY